MEVRAVLLMPFAQTHREGAEVTKAREMADNSRKHTHKQQAGCSNKNSPPPNGNGGDSTIVYLEFCPALY